MRVFLVPFILLVVSACGPTQKASQVLKKLNDDEFVKAEKIVNKALEKDSLLPANLYAKSQLLIAYDSPEFYDSAYWYINKAIAQYDSLDDKIKEQHVKKGFGLDSLVRQKEVIDSLAFQWAQKKNTEESFNYFLANYEDANQAQLAKTKRNALAFASAISINTYQGYQEFIQKYPGAVQVQDARARYEKLFFDKSTADGKVTSFIRFLEKNPDTPYRKEAERNIFEVVTSEHSVGGYQIFLKNYPDSYLRKKAINYAYHVAKTNDNQRLNIELSDSLQRAKRLEPFGLIPFIESEKYGFMDTEGTIIIEPFYDSVSLDYNCKVTHTDFLRVENRLLGRNGQVISDVNYQEVWDLGNGLLKIKNKNKYGIIHKSGEVIEETVYEEIKLLNGNILALRSGNNWRLKTVSGRLLVSDSFEDIFMLEDIVVMERNDKYVFKTPAQLLKAVDGNPIYFDYTIFDYELLNSGRVWIATENEEFIIDQNLNYLTPSSIREIEVLETDFILKGDQQYILLDKEFNEVLKTKSELSHSDYWLLADNDSVAYAIQLGRQRKSLIRANSFSIYGELFLISYNNDTISINTPNKRVFTLVDSKPKLEILSSKEASYLKVEVHDEVVLVDSAGNKIIPYSEDKLDPIGKEYLIYTYRNKKGLLSSLTGEILLKPEFDAIGNYDDGSVSLLKKEKFGIYNKLLGLKTSVKYDKNIMRYNDSTFVVSTNGKEFFHDLNNEIYPEKGFDRIGSWSDTLALVSVDGEWAFYNLNTREKGTEIFQSYQIEVLENGERLAIVRSEGKYGVFSNIKGELVPPTFNDLIVLENGNEPIFFAEKHIAEAEFYVVIYYNHKGEIIKKQAYEPSDYFRLYCDQ